MVRVGMRWLIGAAILVWAVIVVIDTFTPLYLPWWFGSLPITVIAVLVVVRVVRAAFRPDGWRSVRKTLTPAGQGLDEVQGIQLGRPPGLVVTYGDDEPAEATLVVPRTDPLDSGHWTIGPDGDVILDEGDQPADHRGPQSS
jgi:hypothetical protein